MEINKMDNHKNKELHVRLNDTIIERLHAMHEKTCAVNNIHVSYNAFVSKILADYIVEHDKDDDATLKF